MASAAGCKKKKVIQGYPDSFVGVGLELTLKDDMPWVVRALDGGPADLAGVEKGDLITAVDGTPTEGLSLGDVVVKLRGRPDSQVTLGVRRGGQRILVVVKRTKLTKAMKKNYKAER